jgi:Protein of unknown function (DUF4238)
VTVDRWLQPDDITQQEYERLKRPEDPPTFQEWVLAQGDNLADKIRVRFIQAAMDNERLGQRLNAMIWNVLDVSRSRFRLLTSDWPLHRRISGDRHFFALPISPTVLFTVASHADNFENARRKKPDELVRDINMAAVGAARLCVYAQDRSQERFIQNRMATNMEPTPFFPTLVRPLRRGTAAPT